MSALEPKPPELLQNIKWFCLYGVKHWKYVVVAIIFLMALWFIKIYVTNLDNKPVEEMSHKNSVKTSVKIRESKSPIFAPIVKFTDGVVKTVEMNMQFQIDAEFFIKAHTLYGSQEAATDSLKNSIKGAAISVLELETENYVRTHREKVSNTIVMRTIEAQKRTGYMIIELSIGEIY